MRYITFLRDGISRPGVLEGQTVRPFPVEIATLADFVALGPARRAALAPQAALALADVTLAAPLRPCKNVFCVGRNYMGHAEEVARASGKPHGKVFHYVSPNTDVLGWVYERACGAPYARILSEYLWQPMGAAEDASMTLDASGAARVAGGISATARDLARFGEMIRCRGVANGRQVVPGWWIDDIHANGDSKAWSDGDLADIFPGGRYRSKWYTIDPARCDLAAIGIHGQWIYVDTLTDTVIVKLATQPKAMDIPLDHRWLAAFRAIAALLAGS